MYDVEKLISVIVPVYQIRDYLEKCIESIREQTYQNLEILLIDDGSNDSSEEICDRYGGQDSRIRVYHKQNGGVADARNYGLAKATGEYITFVDGDDYISKDCLETLCTLLESAQACISVCGAKVISENTIDEKQNKVLKINEYSSLDALSLCLRGKMRHTLWGKLYRRELFEGFSFPTGKIYEDIPGTFVTLLNAKKVAVSNTEAYFYVMRKKSVMHSDFSKGQLVETEIIDQTMDVVEAAYPSLRHLTDARRINSYFSVLRRILYSNQAEEYLELRKELRKKIMSRRKGLLTAKDVDKHIKIKVFSYFFGEKTYMFCQRMADRHNAEVLK